MTEEERLLNIIKAQSDCIHNMWQNMQTLNEQIDMLITEDISKKLIKLNTIPEHTETQTLEDFVKQAELVKG